MNFPTNCHKGITKQQVFCVAHLSEGLSTVKADSFLIQDFSISDTWSRTSSYRHKVCKTNSVPNRVPFTAMWNGTGMELFDNNIFGIIATKKGNQEKSSSVHGFYAK